MYLWQYQIHIRHEIKIHLVFLLKAFSPTFHLVVGLKSQSSFSSEMILKFGRARGLETEHLFYVA